MQSKEKAERDKLIHKLRREKKGALREIRLDRSFLSKLKIKEQTQRFVELTLQIKIIKLCVHLTYFNIYN